MRIVHVLGRLDRGGAETLIMNIYRMSYIQNIQFDFVIHTKDECDYTEEILRLGGKIYNCPKFNGLNLIRYMKWWNEFFKQNNYKIVHGHVRSTALIYLKIAKKLGVKTIIHSHNTSSGHGLKALVKTVLQFPIRYIPDYFIACSKEAGIWLFGKKVCNKENFKILNNGVNLNAFDFSDEKRDSIRKKLNIRNDEILIGHVGRFHEQKNHKKIIEIFYELQRSNSNFKLILIGKGETKKDIVKKINDFNLMDRIFILENVSNVNEFMQAFDLFLFPSLYEGLGIVLIEAQCSNLPCLISTTIPEKVIINENVKKEYLSASNLEWANDVLNLLNEKDNRKSKIETLKNHGYDIVDTCKILCDVYKELLCQKN